MEKQPQNQPSPQAPAQNTDGSAQQDADVVAADLLVEEVSIDGMCGVY